MRDKLLICTFLATLSFFSIFYVWNEDISVSTEERRMLTTMQDVNHYQIYDKNFSSEFEKYALDQVAFRNELRQLKAFVTYDVFRQLDNHGLFYQDKHWFKKDKPIQANNIERFTQKVSEVLSTYANADAYMMIIPEKQFYLGNGSKFPAIKQSIQSIQAVDMNIEDVLNLDSYFYGDPHVSQTAYLKILPYLEDTMKLAKRDDVYTKHSYHAFIGAYAAQGAYKQTIETIDYFANDVMNMANVSYYDDPSQDDVYNEEKLESLDSYHVFMNGPASFIKIENTEAEEDKTLLIVSDSYGSAVAPLLLAYYKNVYMIDLRYINVTQAQALIEDKIDDVVLVYGELSIRESSNFK